MWLIKSTQCAIILRFETARSNDFVFFFCAFIFTLTMNRKVVSSEYSLLFLLWQKNTMKRRFRYTFLYKFFCIVNTLARIQLLSLVYETMTLRTMLTAYKSEHNQNNYQLHTITCTLGHSFGYCHRTFTIWKEARLFCASAWAHEHDSVLCIKKRWPHFKQISVVGEINSKIHVHAGA